MKKQEKMNELMNEMEKNRMWLQILFFHEFFVFFFIQEKWTPAKFPSTQNARGKNFQVHWNYNVGFQQGIH